TRSASGSHRDTASIVHLAFAMRGRRRLVHRCAGSNTRTYTQRSQPSSKVPAKFRYAMASDVEPEHIEHLGVADAAQPARRAHLVAPRCERAFADLRRVHR